MSVKVILDTDILSEYLKGHNAAVARRAEAYAKEHGVFAFTSVTVFEIVYGLELEQASTQLAKVLAWLDLNEEIAPTALDYRSAASIRAAAQRLRLHCPAPGLSDRRNRSPRGPSLDHRQHGGFSGDSANRRQTGD